jgi:hypothetical protein
MLKFVIFGLLAYLAIGLVFLRATITGLAKQKRADLAYKNEYPGSILFFATFFWPVLPLIYLVISGVIKDVKKLKQEIETLESLLAKERFLINQYESLIEAEPSTKHLFENDLLESRRKCTKWEEDLSKLKAQLERSAGFNA